MARKPPPQAMRTRAQRTAAAMASPSATAAAEPKKRVSLGQFWKQVQQEARRVTWTSRRETWITSVMVAIMVVIAVIYFALVDGGISFAINQILKLAAG